MRIARAIAAVCLFAVACGGSTPSAPAPASVSPAAPPATDRGRTSGQIVDAATNTAAAGIAIEGDGLARTTSNAAGGFTIAATADASDARSVTLTGANYIARHAFMKVPGPDARVSLIPGTFDLQAFDEMFRPSLTLRRWVEAPPLRIQTRTLQFVSLDGVTLTALDDEMSDAEFTSLVQDVTTALSLLTGGTFNAFASITRETARPGEAVTLLNDHAITIARVLGLTAGAAYWGYSRWRTTADSTVVGGMSMIDVQFDRSTTAFKRSLRAHELGHALGYSHVTVRQSVMNSDARTEPNEFDRTASRIAFQRAPANRSPDADPAPSVSINRAAGALWSRPIP